MNWNNNKHIIGDINSLYCYENSLKESQDWQMHINFQLVNVVSNSLYSALDSLKMKK